MTARGSAAEVAAELRLHTIRAAAHGDRAVVVDGTALGSVLLWVRRDQAHFVDALGYPASMVPVVDVDLWDGLEVFGVRPRVLLVTSAMVGTIIVCPVKTTRAMWTRRSAAGDRGYKPVWTCPREQMQSFGWLKKHLLGGV